MARLAPPASPLQARLAVVVRRQPAVRGWDSARSPVKLLRPAAQWELVETRNQLVGRPRLLVGRRIQPVGRPRLLEGRPVQPVEVISKLEEVIPRLEVGLKRGSILMLAEKDLLRAESVRAPLAKPRAVWEPRADWESRGACCRAAEAR